MLLISIVGFLAFFVACISMLILVILAIAKKPTRNALTVFVIAAAVYAISSLYTRVNTNESSDRNGPVQDTSETVAQSDQEDILTSTEKESFETEVGDKPETNNAHPEGVIDLNGDIPCPSIEKTVIYDDDVLTITVKGMKKDRLFDAYDVQLLITNHSDRTISYWSQYAEVNGYTIGITTMFQDIFAGKSANVNVGLDKDSLKMAGIKRIQDIVLNLRCHYEDEDDSICDLVYPLTTSDAGAYEESYEFAGVEIYNTDDYRIVMCANDRVTESEPAIIYIENRTDRELGITFDNIALNDVMVSSTTYGPHVLPHSHAVSVVHILYFGEKPEIDNIDSVTTALTLIPYREDGGFSSAEWIDVPPVTVPLK